MQTRLNNIFLIPIKEKCYLKINDLRIVLILLVNCENKNIQHSLSLYSLSTVQIFMFQSRWMIAIRNIIICIMIKVKHFIQRCMLTYKNCSLKDPLELRLQYIIHFITHSQWLAHHTFKIGVEKTEASLRSFHSLVYHTVCLLAIFLTSLFVWVGCFWKQG